MKVVPGIHDESFLRKNAKHTASVYTLEAFAQFQILSEKKFMLLHKQTGIKKNQYLLSIVL